MKPFDIFTKLVPICGLMMIFAAYGWGDDIASADDICYDSVTTDETTVLPGTTFYGTTIILRNIGEETLSDVTIIKSFSDINMSLMGEIKLDGVQKTVDSDDDSAEVNQTLLTTFSSFAMEGIFDKGIIYYPDGDGTFSSEETHTIYDYSTFSFNWENVSLNALFTKGTTRYKAKINACPIIIKFPLEIYQISENYSAAVGSTSLLETRITLSKAVTYPVAFDYGTIDGTALAGSDFIAVSGRITIPAGATETIISIPIYHDIEIELQESFTLKISNVTASGDVQIGTNPTEIQILEQSAENLPVCYEDDFNDGSLDDKWRTLGNGVTPEIVDSRLRLTPASGGTTAVTKDYEFPSKYNMIVVEFDQFAYGGNIYHNSGAPYGGDGMVAVLYDSAVGASPTTGAQGGAMGYAQMVYGTTSTAGFEGGWLGLGIDEFGNFANCSEGKVGGINTTSCTDRYPNYATIRGDGSGTSGYDFLAASEQLNPAVANADTSIPAPGHRYKMTTDARDPNHLYITLERNTGSGYQVVINQFDAKDAQYGQTTTPELVRFALTAGTGGATNNHEIDNLKVSGICRAYDPEQPPLSTSLADMVDDFNIDNYNNPNSNSKYIKTKVSDKLEPLTAVRLNESQNAEVFTSINPALFFKVIPYISDDTCTQRAPVLDADGNPLVINITDGNAAATASGYMPNTAIAVTRFSLSALDMSKIYEASFYESCLLNSSTIGNLQGIGSCVNSETKYKKIFGDAAWERCYNNNGQPCKSNNNGVGTGIYANDYGCLMCTLDSNITCSSDNFAIRPHAFKAFSQNQYKRAAEDFNITIKAVNETQFAKNTGTALDVNGSSDYNASSSTLNVTSETYAASSTNITLMQNHTGKTDVTLCPESGIFTITPASFINGEVNTSIKYSEAGIVDVNISEIPGSEFALIDADDTNDQERYITPATLVHDITDISKTNILLFTPYSFNTSATYETTNGMDWLYMNDINQSNTTSTTPDMSAYVSYVITAKNKDGNTVKNYTATCFPDTNAPSVNGLKINSTFDLDLDLNINSSAVVNISLYSEDNDSNGIWTPTKNQSLVAGVNNIQEWIAPFQFDNGIGKATVYFNIDRNNSSALNPVLITVIDANTSTDWMSDSGSPENFNGAILNTNKSFVYGKTNAPKQIFIGDTGTGLIYYEVFCNKTDGSATVCDKTLLPNGSTSQNTDDPRWFKNTSHSPTNSGVVGKIIHKGGTGAASDTVDASNTTGTNPDNTTLSYDKSKGYPYKTTMENNASRWLIYNMYNASATKNNFEVEFQSLESDWTGIKDTNNTAVGRGAFWTNKRLDW
ncbi:MAG TPA: hypothetical protein CFH84_08450 [Sulfurimonas sp. UBA12504]|nr:MAG: hypothetical protein A2019_00015 [Sulfurimonas sp. GWF2_37_8]DAB29636.1 MAG TPA: hypothetical protein CFH84_08450 [Sulfurimonas sp. UBA12504]